MKKLMTLCIPIKDDKILLGMKKRGFGVGRWNGFGGKIFENETFEQGAWRELFEEVNIQDGVLEKRGILEFVYKDSDISLEVHIFKLTNFDHKPTETEEMKPEWFLLHDIPFNQMWPDDIFWLPLFLKEKLFKGTFLFDKPSDAEYTSKILNQKLDEVSTLD